MDETIVSYDDEIDVIEGISLPVYPTRRASSKCSLKTESKITPPTITDLKLIEKSPNEIVEEKKKTKISDNTKENEIHKDDDNELHRNNNVEEKILFDTKNNEDERNNTGEAYLLLNPTQWLDYFYPLKSKMNETKLVKEIDKEGEKEKEKEKEKGKGKGNGRGIEIDIE